jgi:hypothetical protein
MSSLTRGKQPARKRNNNAHKRGRHLPTRKMAIKQHGPGQNQSNGSGYRGEEQYGSSEHDLGVEIVWEMPISLAAVRWSRSKRLLEKLRLRTGVKAVDK